MLTLLRTFSIAVFVFVVFAVAGVSALQAQTSTETDTQRGIKLYQAGNTRDAIAALGLATKKEPNNADAWHYLGLSLAASDRNPEARKAFERAIKIRPGYAPSHAALGSLYLKDDKLSEAGKEAETARALGANDLNTIYLVGRIRLRDRQSAKALQEAESALGIDPKFGPGLLLKADALLGLFRQSSGGSSNPAGKPRYLYLKQAAQTLALYFQHYPDEPKTRGWFRQMEALSSFLELPDQLDNRDQDKIYQPEQVTKKAKIVQKPFPEYTERAREAGVKGTVRLQAVFGADGTVRSVDPILTLSGGLTEEAIRVARLITFVPATIDGRPVSQYIKLEYNFDIY